MFLVCRIRYRYVPYAWFDRGLVHVLTLNLHGLFFPAAVGVAGTATYDPPASDGTSAAASAVHALPARCSCSPDSILPAKSGRARIPRRERSSFLPALRWEGGDCMERLACVGMWVSLAGDAFSLFLDGRKSLRWSTACLPGTLCLYPVPWVWGSDGVSHSCIEIKHEAGRRTCRSPIVLFFARLVLLLCGVVGLRKSVEMNPFRFQFTQGKSNR